MPYSKEHYTYTYPGSDGVHKLANQVRQTTPHESLYRLINSSLSSCQGYNREKTMLTEALATTTQPKKEKKPNSRHIMQLEIVVNLILIGVTLLVSVNLQTDVVETPTDIHHTSQHQGRQ